MSRSARLALSYVMPSQAQKHVTVNESLRRLDILVQTSVSSAARAAEPPEPAEGAAFILPAGATGPAWGAMAPGSIAVVQDGAFEEIAPRPGHLAFVEDEARLVVYAGAAGWVPAAGGERLDRLGVNTDADAANRLSVKSDQILFSHDDRTPGSGDCRAVVSKKGLGHTAALLFQTGFSGRAEIGLVGDDALAIKVSPNGSAFTEVLRINPANGRVGIRQSAPGDTLHLGGPSDPALRVQEDGSGSYAELCNRGPGQSVLGHISPIGSALIDLSPRPLDGTSGASFRFFRETQTTGRVGLDIHVGNNTFATNHRLEGNGHSFLAMQEGRRLRVGSAETPACTLDVAGPVRVGAYVVAALPRAGAGAGQIVLVTDDSEGPTLAFSDGARWRRVQDRAEIATAPNGG